jgi:hypothetical protein
MPAIQHPGRDRLWLWFGLSRSSWMTLPRVLMHDMPDDWQRRMAELMEEWDATWINTPDLRFTVTAKSGRKFVKLPEFLTNYRHPDHDAIACLRGPAEDVQ